MKTAKFTKGEWRHEEGIIYSKNTGDTIAKLIPMAILDEEADANALLMVAAPELFNALTLLHEAYLIIAEHKGVDYLNSETGKIVINALNKVVL